MTIKLATIVLALSFGGSTLVLAQTPSTPSTSAPTASPPVVDEPTTDDRVKTLEGRMDDMESKLDRILMAVERGANKSATSNSDTTAVVAQDAPLSAEASSATSVAPVQLEPGFVAKVFPLKRDRLVKKDQPLAAFTITEPEFDYEAHLAHSLFGKGTDVAYELSGFLNVEEAGDHSFGVMLAGSNSYSSCGVEGNVEGQSIFDNPRLRLAGEKEFVPAMGMATLQPGLYELRFWIACNRGRRSFPTVKLIHRSPSQSAPQFLDVTKVGHQVN